MATHIWQGDAPEVQDLWTATPGGTIGTETFTLTINEKSLAYTAESGDTVADVVAALVALWNNTTNPPPPEFREGRATNNATHLTISAVQYGRPLIITAEATGSATLVMNNIQPATGSRFADNVTNWDSGSAVSNGDTLIFDRGSTDVLYGLDAFDANTTLTVRVLDGYRGRIGLPEINQDGDNYSEYRPKHLQVSGGTIEINASQLTRCRIDHQSTATTVRILNTGQRPESAGVPVVTLIGSHASNTLDISRGDAGLAVIDGEQAQFPVIRMSYVNNRDADARLECGSGCTLGAIEKTGGQLVTRSAIMSLRQGPSGGTATVQSGAVTGLTADGGTVVYNSTGTLTSWSVAGDGFVDFDQDTRPKTATNPAKCYGSNWRIRDSKGVVNSGAIVLDLVRNNALQNFTGPTDRRYTQGAIS